MTRHPANGVSAAALTRFCPGFVAVGPPVETGTSRLQHGTIGERPVIMKHPTDPRPWWQDRCRQEITVYRTLAGHRPPVQVPELVAADTDAPLLIVTRLPGTPLHPDRYPAAGAIPAALVTRLLSTLDRLHQWQQGGRRGLFPDDSDYQAQVNALPDDLLTADIKDQLTALFDRAGIVRQLSHGDAHFGNALDTATGTALLDFELTAVRPRGYDEAKLFTFLADNPTARHPAAVRGGRDAQAGFWLAVVLVTCREIISHRRHPDLPDRDRRLTHLHTDLILAVGRCQALNDTF